MVEKLRSPKNVRRLAIAGWCLIALVFLAYFLIVLRLDFAEMLVPCQGASCFSLALSTAEIAVLASWGLSIQTYAIYMSAIMVFVTAVYWALGGVIVWRQGSGRVGLAVSLALIIIPISMYGGSTDWATYFPKLVIPGIFLNLFGTIIMLVFFYLIPNGRFSPRWASIPLTITILLVTLLTLHINGIFLLSDMIQSLLGTSIVGLVILGGGLQIYRYRRDSTPLERQQTKWILLGVLTFIFSVIVWVLIFGKVLDIPPGKPRVLANLVGWFSDIFILLSLPAAITIAILRYRLWDIDLIIRRTLQYAILTGLLGLLYFGSVVLGQRLVGLLTGEPDSRLVLVISTLLMAALFNPLRTRVQNFIDRRFFRQKYDALQTLAVFTHTARDETQLDSLIPALLNAVNNSLHPDQAWLWLKMKEK
jgi:hypothetical protein